MRFRARWALQATAGIFFILSIGDLKLNAQGILTSFGGTAPSAATVSPFSYELNAEGSFFGTGSANLGSKNVGDITEIASLAKFVLSAQVRDTVLLRLGAGWLGYFFYPEPKAPIPGSLQAESLEVGADIQVTPALLARIEALPGIYSNAVNITSRAFNVPFEIAASYFVSADLILLAGVYVDVNASTPVFPVIGVHWKLSDKWVIEGMPPRPQIQYILSDSVTLFAGADLREETFVVDNQFGTSRGMPHLNNAILEYNEIRAGAGLTWKVYKNVTLDIEGGCTPYRRFDYAHVADGIKVKSEDWVPYLRVGLSALF
ncbi:MAG TPA: DUF6268 family outer membrane beta-barrel protein [Chthoniobacterales bacterium]|jgi:hypothetical protein